MENDKFIISCPICGYRDFIELKQSFQKYYYFCSHCNTSGPICSSPEKALELWNNRKIVKTCPFCGSQIQDIGECSVCKSIFSKSNKFKKMACCYIDALGFSNASKKSIEEALRIVQNFEDIYESKDNGSKEFSSFYHFLPYSDSIFICSDNPDKFVNDLSEFIFQSLNLTSHFYFKPQDPNNPQEVNITNFKFENNKLVLEQLKENWWLTLFKGGISFGDISVIEQHSTFGNHSEMRKNLTGKALVESVNIGEKLNFHGARILCSEEFYNSLSKDIQKRYFIEIIKNENKYYELLWPLCNFLDSNIKNGISLVILNGMMHTLPSICNFYKAFRTDCKLEKVYFNTLKLFYNSIEHYLTINSASQKEKNEAYLFFENTINSSEIFKELQTYDYKDD